MKSNAMASGAGKDLPAHLGAPLETPPAGGALLSSAPTSSAPASSVPASSASLDSPQLNSGQLASASLNGTASPRDAASLNGAAASPNGANGIPEATVARLPVYLRALYGLAERGVSTVASEELAAAAGVNSAKLRKDLSHLGSYGIRGVGYDVDYLVYQVSRTLGLTQDWPVVIVGAGNLGHALANYGGFVSRGFRIAALLDSDPAIVGSKVAKLVVRHSDELEAVVARHKVAIGVIATPAGAAQAVCDRLVSAGVTSVLNFAPMVLCVPEGVDVRKVDLSIELQILAFHAQRKAAGPRGAGESDDAVRLHAAQPDTAQPDTAQPDAVQPDTASARA